MEDLAVGRRTIGVHVLLQSRVALWFDVTGEETRAVKFEQRLKQISAAAIHDLLDLVVAGILPEALVVQVGLVEFDRTAIIAQHELLERHEAHVP